MVFWRNGWVDKTRRFTPRPHARRVLHKTGNDEGRTAHSFVKYKAANQETLDLPDV